jgi:hypothetical protein
MHLVGFNIRIYHDARSHERKISLMMVTLEQPKHVAAIYNCYIKGVH